MTVTASAAERGGPGQTRSGQVRGGRARGVLTRWWFGLALAGVFVLAVLVRLGATVRGAGLYGLGNYDDGVHFAAALGLVNGLLPYRDFLLLHPPGVVLALAPFAALSWLVGEPHAMAVARLAWIVLGGANAVLCGLALRPVSRAAGLLAALFYALSFGAMYVEHTTLLESPATTVLLLGLVLTRLLGTATGIRDRHYLLAGVLLGLSPALKIWGVVAVLVLVVTLAARRGRRPALLTLGAAVASCTAACLPFFLSAPAEMWRMVVVAQLGRRRTVEPVSGRLDDVLGVRAWTGASGQWNALLLAVLVIVLGATVLCLLRAELRVLAALMITHGALVMTTPMWFLHYAGLTAAPMALVVGGALAVLMSWMRPLRWVPPTLASLALLGTLVLAWPLHDIDLGDKRFPGEQLRTKVADFGGCTTTDWPMTLIQMDLLQTDIDRGCRFVVDLGGYSYYLIDSPYHQESRRKNQDWQALALEYYRSGDAVISVRFSTASGFSKRTAEIVGSWPVLAEAGGYAVRRPETGGS
jgi:alpha-1,2-mannosyltransferase